MHGHKCVVFSRAANVHCPWFGWLKFERNRSVIRTHSTNPNNFCLMCDNEPWKFSGEDRRLLQNHARPAQHTKQPLDAWYVREKQKVVRIAWQTHTSQSKFFKGITYINVVSVRTHSRKLVIHFIRDSQSRNKNFPWKNWWRGIEINKTSFRRNNPSILLYTITIFR